MHGRRFATLDAAELEAIEDFLRAKAAVAGLARAAIAVTLLPGASN